MSKELDVAKSIILNNLNANLSMESLGSLYEITNGNKKVLLAHIKVYNNIFNKAKKQLEEEMKENDKGVSVNE